MNDKQLTNLLDKEIKKNSQAKILLINESLFNDYKTMFAKIEGYSFNGSQYIEKVDTYWKGDLRVYSTKQISENEKFKLI